MGLVICPNCKKSTFDDERCAYCHYVLKKREHEFDEEIYQFLYEDYKKTGMKSETIRTAQSRFGLSVAEAKKILDTIADEVYDEEDHRSYDEINDNGRYDDKIFRCSFRQYFFRVMIYKILFWILWIEGITVYSRTEWYEYNVGRIIFAAFWIVGLICLIVFGRQFARAQGSYVVLDNGIIGYIISMPAYRTERERERGVRREVNDIYAIDIVKEVKEHRNYFMVYGNIRYTVQKSRYVPKSGGKRLSKVKIPKYFNNKDVLELLYSYKRS